MPAVTVLAQRADAEVFGPNDPTPEQVDAFWQEVDQIVLGLGKDAGFFTRLKARLSLRSLLKDSTVTSRLQGLKDAATARVRREPGTIDKNSPPASESESA